jgi:glycosyltransferase involved in cell wall biosynthesis
MLNQPLVSVLIPLYNKVLYFEETIQSVLNQTYQNIEIIIVDDGSTDGSLALARGFISEKINVFEQQNKGASAARNKAFELSKGDFIQYLDADDTLDLRKIEEQINVITKHPDCLITARRFDIRETSNHEIKLVERTLLSKDYTEVVQFISDDILEGAFVHSWLMPRHIVAQSGGWDETISVFDDRDFNLRFIPLAAKIIYCPTAICYYRTKANAQSNRRNESDLAGALNYFSKVELLLLGKENKLDLNGKKAISRLCIMLLILGLNNKNMKNIIYARCIHYDIAPACYDNRMIGFCKKTLGVKITFKLLVIFLSRKYASKR